jgi:hypothetical protein
VLRDNKLLETEFAKDGITIRWGTLANPKRSRAVPLSALQGAAKWTSLAADGVRAITDGLRLADFFDIKRGLATGAAGRVENQWPHGKPSSGFW